jgi:membrane-bound lytic murein transglycosylase D
MHIHKLWLLVSLLLAGCAADSLFSARNSEPVSTILPEPLAPAPYVTLEAVEPGGQPGTLPENDLPSAGPDWTAATEAGVPVEVTDPEEDPELEPVELDPETLADNQILQGEDQIPPEEPGQSVVRDEPEFDFPVVENDQVRYFVEYYTGRARGTFQLWLERSSRYIPMMREIFAEAGLPRDLAYLAMVESGFNPKAYSWAHAVGPWQFIETTAKRYGLVNDWWHDERRDPEKATRAAARFLADLYEDFDGDWYLAVASYNAGPGKLRQAVRKYNTRDFWQLSSKPYLRNETKNYIPKLLAVLLIAKQPEKFGFTDLAWHEPFDYDTFLLPTSTDLEVIARLCEVDYDTIKQFNPELKRWSSPPDVKNYQVRIPVESGPDFAEQYARLPVAKRANYQRHKLKSGDTLLALSQRYGVRTSDIQRLNHISNPRALQIGSDLIIPLNPDYNGRAVAELKDDYTRSTRTYYTVRSGDSLWKVARKFGVSEKQLRVWNRLGWSNVIRPGQNLIVSAKAAPQQRNADKVVNMGPERKVVYLVRSGDTLWGIGQQFSVDTAQIRAWNNLSENHVLQPGDKLTLMVRGSVSG